MGYFGGFLVTLRQHGARNKVTTEYSGGRVFRRKNKDTKDQKIEKPERLHGRHVLNRYEDGMEKCIGCELCAGVCPARCIYVRGKDNDETKLFEFSFTNRQDAIYTKNELLVGDDGMPQHLPWEDWRPGEDMNTSGWMRATAPAGDATFEGVVSWSGELGYGVRAPEPNQSERDRSEEDGHDHGKDGAHH